MGQSSASGDCVKVWADDVYDSPVWLTKTGAQDRLTQGCWAPARPSVLLTADLSGAVSARVSQETWASLYSHPDISRDRTS